jgi:hypothetical protein
MVRRHTSTVPLQQSVGIYDEDGHALFVLNPTASEIWDRCDGAANFEQIVEDLAQSHSADLHEVRDDVWRTLHQLAELGLVAERQPEGDDSPSPATMGGRGQREADGSPAA